MAPISELRELKPTKKLLVMNLLKEAGADVSKWQNYKGKSHQPLSDQFTDVAGPKEEHRRLIDDLCPEQIARQG